MGLTPKNVYILLHPKYNPLHAYSNVSPTAFKRIYSQVNSQGCRFRCALRLLRTKGSEKPEAGKGTPVLCKETSASSLRAVAHHVGQSSSPSSGFAAALKILLKKWEKDTEGGNNSESGKTEHRQGHHRKSRWRRRHPALAVRDAWGVSARRPKDGRDSKSHWFQRGNALNAFVEEDRRTVIKKRRITLHPR